MTEGTLLRISAPLDGKTVGSLRAGDRVLLDGTVYTARDAAHKRLVEAIEAGATLPIPLEGQVIYYVGPCPARPGAVIGPAGPTTSYRMDPYTPVLLERGLKGMIGKGKRGPEVIAAIRKHRAVYLGATGGAAALLARSITAQRIVAYGDLGPEALRELTVEAFPATVVVDASGRDLYSEGPQAYGR
ncbi:MAG: Fe-S-containing hydro-lyase [Synergistales bacterium]|nr:Fe-S-containing hydro-lyase [Synergistales bacterium]